MSTHALVEAPLSDARTRWPVLLFSHGRSFPVENYQIALEQLSSQGWIIAAISHPYEEAATLLPDGTTLPFSGPTWDDDSRRGEVLAGVVDDLVLDASLVVDRVEALNRDAASRFAGRLDLARGVGYFGHSLGGAAAVRAQQRDSRVSAVASWEGQVYRAEERPLRVRAPLLYFIAGANRAEFMGAHYRPAAGGGPVYEVIVHGAWHPSFGDMLHIYGQYADADWHERHRRAMHPLRANPAVPQREPDSQVGSLRLLQPGAIPVKQAVYVLLDTSNARDCEWLKTEIKAAGVRVREGPTRL